MNNKIKVLELFAGTKSIGKAAEELGYEVFSSDIEGKFNTDYTTDLLNFDVNKVPWKPDIMWCSPPCFGENELGMTENGYTKIKDIKIGEYVLTHNNRYRKVTKVYENYSDNCYDFKTRQTKNTIVTGNHPYLVKYKKRKFNNKKRGYDYFFTESSWVNVEDIKIKKNSSGTIIEAPYVAIPINKEKKLPNYNGCLYDQSKSNQYKKQNNTTKVIKTLPLNNINFWYIVGRFIGDGWIFYSKNNSKSVNICCNKNETEFLKEKIKLVFDNFSLSTEKETVDQFIFYNKELYEYFKQFGIGAPNKKITSDIFNLPLEYLKLFIDGLMDSDGHIEGNKYSLTTSSEELAYGFQYCINKLYNIPTTLTINDRTGKYTHIGDRKVYYKHKMFIVEYKLNVKNIKYDIDDEYIWVQFNDKIKLNDTIKTYNLEVEEDNTYTIKNVIVHNCTSFSIASVSHHWTKDKQPKTDTARIGYALVQKTLELIEYYKPTYWYIENPRGLLRKFPIMESLPIRNTVTYCQYNYTNMKPTDIWTNNPLWIPRPMCKNGDKCHESAPRGSKTGTQGYKNAMERSRIPHELCLEIMSSIKK
jgi:hypothetical protein